MAAAVAEPTTETKPPTPTPSNDDWSSTLMADLGLAIGQAPAALPEEGKEGEAPAPATPPAPVVAPRNTPSMTLGERARMLDQDAKDKKDSGQDTPPADTPTPPPAATETPAGEVPPVVTPPPVTPPPVAVEKKRPWEDRVGDVVERTMREALKNAPGKPATPAPVVTPPDSFEATLSEAQKDELEVARFAAKSKADKHKDLPAKLLAFYKKLDDYYTRERQEHPERTFDETDDEFQKFLRANKPVMEPTERRKIEREMVATQAADQARKATLEELAPMRREHHALKTRPVIEDAVSKFTKGLDELLLESGDGEVVTDVAKQAKEHGWQKVAEQDPVFGAAAAGLTRAAQGLASEYMALAHGVKDFAQDNPRHAWIFNFVKRVENDIANDPERSVKDGRKFLSSAEYHKAVADDASAPTRFFTVTDFDILNGLAINTREQMKAVLKNEEERLKRAGFERKKPASAPAKPETQRQTENPPKTPPAKKEDETPSPRAVPSSSPGAGKGGGGVPTNTFFSPKEMELIGATKEQSRRF